MQDIEHPKTKRRYKKKAPPTCDAKNLAEHMRQLLDRQIIEIILPFYTPQLIAMIASVDADLKSKIQHAASQNSDIAELCVLVDLEPGRMSNNAFVDMEEITNTPVLLEHKGDTASTWNNVQQVETH